MGKVRKLSRMDCINLSPIIVSDWSSVMDITEKQNELTIIVEDEGVLLYKTIRVDGRLNFLLSAPIIRDIRFEFKYSCLDLSSLVVSEWGYNKERKFLNTNDVDIILASFDWQLDDVVFYNTIDEYKTEQYYDKCYPIEVITIEVLSRRIVNSILCDGVPIYRYGVELEYDKDVYHMRRHMIYTPEELCTYSGKKYVYKEPDKKYVINLGEKAYRTYDWNGKDMKFLGVENKCLCDSKNYNLCCNISKPLKERLQLAQLYGLCSCYSIKNLNTEILDLGGKDVIALLTNIMKKKTDDLFFSDPGYANPIPKKDWYTLKKKSIRLINELYINKEFPNIVTTVDDSPYNIRTHFGRIRL